MQKKPLSFLPIVFLSLVIVVAIGYTVSQFYNVEKRLHNITNAVFYKAVDASYDIVDATVNESLKNYLRGIAFSTQQMINVTQDENLRLNQVLVKKTLDQFISNTHIGDSGYISILNSSGIYTSHPYLQGEDVSDLEIIQKQLSEPETFLEYQWQNPNDQQSRLKVAYSIKLTDGSVISASVYKDEMLSLIDKELLKDKLTRYDFGETGYVYVADSQGTLLLHPTSEGQSLYTLIGDSTYAFMKQIKTQPNGSFTYPLKLSNGKTVLKTVAYQYYPYLDWIIAAGISEQELSQPTEQLSHSLITAGVSLLLVITGLILGLNSRHKRLIMIERKDFLTGLNNRRSFMESATDYVKKPHSHYSVIIFDIDKFKTINDTFGHNEGDKVIVATAKVLAKFESERILISRHGGEEFVMLLKEINASQAYLMAEIIRQKVAQIHTLQTRFTISAGVFESLDGSNKIGEAISHADHALYNAKETGRNKVVIYRPEHEQQFLNKQS